MRLASFVGLGLSFGLAACGTSNSSGDDYPPVDCSTVTGTDTFVVGLEKPGETGALDFKMMSADPAPPARGDNTWVIQINDMSSGVVGNPVSDASMTVTPFMPAHGHGTPIPVEITQLQDAGQYQLSPVNLWMPGIWETTIDTTAGSSADSVVFRFCIPE